MYTLLCYQDAVSFQKMSVLVEAFVPHKHYGPDSRTIKLAIPTFVELAECAKKPSKTSQQHFCMYPNNKVKYWHTSSVFIYLFNFTQEPLSKQNYNPTFIYANLTIQIL